LSLPRPDKPPLKLGRPGTKRPSTRPLYVHNRPPLLLPGWYTLSWHLTSSHLFPLSRPVFFSCLFPPMLETLGFLGPPPPCDHQGTPLQHTLLLSPTSPSNPHVSAPFFQGQLFYGHFRPPSVFPSLLIHLKLPYPVRATIFHRPSSGLGSSVLPAFSFLAPHR